MQTILSPEQRLEGYEWVRSVIRRHKATINGGICALLVDFLFDNAFDAWLCNAAEDMPKKFIEFGKRKPKKILKNGLWFPDNIQGHEQRIQLLTECIEEVKAIIK